MKTVLESLEAAIRDAVPVTYTALVETRGSTPQKAGASMLVFADGSQCGTLGGGCVEAEVKRRALRSLDAGGPEVLTFQLDGNYGWDDGLICGGRMKMLVDPVRPGENADYFLKLAEAVRRDLASTEAVCLDSIASGVQAGDRWLFDDTGLCIASRTRGSDCPEFVTANLRPLACRPRSYVTGSVAYLPRSRRCRLIVVGAGHVGQKVAEYAAESDFDVWVVDDRDEFCNPQRFPLAKRLIVSPIDAALSGLDCDADTFCLIVTRGHSHDEEALYHLAEKPAGYVGLIGSRRKIKLIYGDLLRAGISAEALRKVHGPLGLEIGSQTVPEIAVSIVAELIAHRNLGRVPQHLDRPNLLDEVLDDRSVSGVAREGASSPEA